MSLLLVNDGYKMNKKHCLSVRKLRYVFIATSLLPGHAMPYRVCATCLFYRVLTYICNFVSVIFSKIHPLLKALTGCWVGQKDRREGRRVISYYAADLKSQLYAFITKIRLNHKLG